MSGNLKENFQEVGLLLYFSVFLLFQCRENVTIMEPIFVKPSTLPTKPLQHSASQTSQFSSFFLRDIVFALLHYFNIGSPKFLCEVFLPQALWSQQCIALISVCCKVDTEARVKITEEHVTIVVGERKPVFNIRTYLLSIS